MFSVQYNAMHMDGPDRKKLSATSGKSLVKKNIISNKIKHNFKRRQTECGRVNITVAAMIFLS